MQRALGALVEVRAGLTSGLTLDVLAATLEAAAGALGEILGRDVDAEVLDRIFSDFCIGK
jgi:tRNA modification GTPase